MVSQVFMHQLQVPKASPAKVGVPCCRSVALSTSAPVSGLTRDQFTCEVAGQRVSADREGVHTGLQNKTQPRVSSDCGGRQPCLPLRQEGFCFLYVGRKTCEIRGWLVGKKKREMQGDLLLLPAETGDVTTQRASGTKAVICMAEWIRASRGHVIKRPKATRVVSLKVTIDSVRVFFSITGISIATVPSKSLKSPWLQHLDSLLPLLIIL